MVYKSVTAENSKYTRYFDMKHDNPPVSIWRKKNLAMCYDLYKKRNTNIIIKKRNTNIGVKSSTRT